MSTEVKESKPSQNRVRDSDFDKKKLKANPIEDKKGDVDYKTIGIKYLYPNGELDNLVVTSKDIFYTFGVAENRSKKNNDLQGYSICISLPSEKENSGKKSSLEKVYEEVYEFLCDELVKQSAATGKKIKNRDSAESLLQNPIYPPSKEGKGKNNKIYPKLMWFKGKNNKSTCDTVFKKITELPDAKTKAPPKYKILDPLGDDVRKPHKMIPALHIRGAFLGASYTVQHSLVSEIYITVPAKVDPTLQDNDVSEIAELMGSTLLGETKETTETTTVEDDLKSLD